MTIKGRDEMNDFKECKINPSRHCLKRSLERGIEIETIEKVIKEGNEIRGKYPNNKYRKLGKIEAAFVPRVCNIFVVTVMRR